MTTERGYPNMAADQGKAEPISIRKNPPAECLDMLRDVIGMAASLDKALDDKLVGFVAPDISPPMNATRDEQAMRPETYPPFFIDLRELLVELRTVLNRIDNTTSRIHL